MKELEVAKEIDITIDYLNKLKDVMKLKPSEVHYAISNIDVLSISDYNIDTDIKELENLKGIYQKLYDNGIDLDKKYYINLDGEYKVYFSFNPELNGLRPFFYIEDGSWIYNNVYGSWSGMNEVITKFICERYEYNKNYGFNNWASNSNTVNYAMSKLNFPYNDKSYSKTEKYYKELYNNVIALHKLITSDKFNNIVGNELKKLFDTLKVEVER